MVALARHRLIMLDYDGTLAPLVPERDEARPLPASLERLQRMSGVAHTSLAIVSGRPVREVVRFLGDLPVTIVGEHGWERRVPGGRITHWTPAPTTADALTSAESAAHAAGLRARLERKRTAVVLHTRGMAEAEARRTQDRCLALWAPLVSPRVTLDRIDGGVELRARGRNKGTVVLSLLAQSEPGTLGAFVGDDVTDEDAIEVVRDWGFGVRVGRKVQPSMAQGYLSSCESLPDFLDEWQRVAEAAA